jgi:paraquat-inducible protein A
MIAYPTAKSCGLALCRDCHKINRIRKTGTKDQLVCSRCGSSIHFRKPDSIARTWAFTITAMIFLIPANIYPVMTVIYFGKGQPETIMSGIIHLMHAGMYPIATLVFVASIAVPVLKIIGIMLMLLTFQRGWKLSYKQCTMVYRFVEFVGRWSMLDLFMISILVTLVDLGAIATITAGPGATAFASVVVLTIFAAMSFDPRLIWDLEEKDDE